MKGDPTIPDTAPSEETELLEKAFAMYRIWFGRVITFDGLLPLAVWGTPWLAAFAFPNRRGLIEVLAILLPVVGFLIRYASGRRLIATNACSAAVRFWQFVSLCLGLILLAFIDCVVVLLHILPRRALQQPGDRVVFVVLGSLYFTFMVAAMYPGPSPDREQSIFE